MLPLLPKLAAFVFLIGAGLDLSGCSEKHSGDTNFKEATKGFKKELTSEQRKAAIKELQTETTSKP
jgi:hypothetical protein